MEQARSSLPEAHNASAPHTHDTFSSSPSSADIHNRSSGYNLDNLCIPTRDTVEDACLFRHGLYRLSKIQRITERDVDRRLLLIDRGTLDAYRLRRSMKHVSDLEERVAECNAYPFRFLSFNAIDEANDMKVLQGIAKEKLKMGNTGASLWAQLGRNASLLNTPQVPRTTYIRIGSLDPLLIRRHESYCSIFPFVLLLGVEGVGKSRVWALQRDGGGSRRRMARYRTSIGHYQS
ncbi:hypothetical protein PM082_018676 [Marasmius tenuissimus]|nr:hypothetical protein PM082_018676 [Marasmius tenuissimus]